MRQRSVRSAAILTFALWAVPGHASAADDPSPPAAPVEPALPAEPESPPAAPAPAAPDRSAEITLAIDGLRSTVMEERVATCKSLSFSGITDTRVYDQVEQNVRTQFGRLRGTAPARDLEQEIGWCAKALAYAGNPRYRPTLEKLATSPRRLADHAETALLRLDDFARWNAIMNDATTHQPGESWEMTRARNMLNSGEPPLEREGLKLVKALKDDPAPLHDLIEQKLLAAYRRPLAHGSDAEDIAAWYCRALAASQNGKYREALRRVEAGAHSKKLRTYARKALGDLAGLD
jgi:hypothetical protein